MKLYDFFSKELQSIPAIDTHQHIRLGHDSTDRPAKQNWGFDNIFTYGSYFAYMNSGLSSLPIDIKTYSEKIKWLRTTSTFRAMVEIPLRDLYGCSLDNFNDNMIPAINSQIERNYSSGSHIWCQEVFHRANIDLALKINVSQKYFEEALPSLSTGDLAIEHKLFKTVWNVNTLILSNPWVDHYEDAEGFGINIDTLEGFLDLIDRKFEIIAKYKCCAIKATLAYERTLEISNVSTVEARSIYKNRLNDNKALQDFLWCYVGKKAGEYNLPFVIHTGVVGNNLIQECNPALLHNLVNHKDCTNTRFVLIHTGYPHTRELVVMAWNTPNVFIDFVWLPMLGFETSIQVLSEFLEWAPLHKFTIGTDCHTIEATYGSMVQSREILSHVLARKCELGIWSEETALNAAKAILRENAKMLYKL